LQVKVSIIGALLKPRGLGQLSQELAEGGTVADLLVALEYQAGHRRHIVAAVDGELRHHDSPLADGDTVVLSVTVGGG
jgi:sulfur carrier protein ThiS